MADIPGTNRNDTLTGTAQDDTITAGTGNDIVDGGAGNDLIFGDNGNSAGAGTPKAYELTGSSGSFPAGEGGTFVNYTVTATNGNLDDLPSGIGEIDGSNYWLGNGGEIETYTYAFDQTISGLKINVIAQDTAETLCQSQSKKGPSRGLKRVH